MDLSYDALKARQRADRDGFPPSLALRTHRALSWLQRAEQESDDLDARFIFLWISFNAAYANEIHDRRRFTERRFLLNFLDRLIESDDQHLLYRAVWNRFAGSIRLLIDNRYVFQPFWDYQNRHISESEWLDRFARSKQRVHRALGRMDTRKVIAIMFDRLYVLRNQIVHGGATWGSSVNRSQVRDGAEIMGFIVPLVIHMMMNHPDKLWGEPCYPVVEG